MYWMKVSAGKIGIKWIYVFMNDVAEWKMLDTQNNSFIIDLFKKENLNDH